MGIVKDAYKLGDVERGKMDQIINLSKTFLEVTHHHAKKECLKKIRGFVQTNYKILENYDDFGENYAKLMDYADNY